MITRRTTIAGAAGLLALSLAACGSTDSGDNEGSGDTGASEDKGTIILGYIPSWTDGLSTAYLLDNQLTEMGYTVEHQTVEDAAVLYTGLANGDIDLYPSAWSERTHRQYMEKFGDDVEDLGWYYDDASLNLSVPDYMDIDSIEDLVGNADRFDGKIIGIEPGAGLTDATEHDVIPAYGLGDDYTLTTSSTLGMLTELEKAIDKQEDIVVTLWKPFWANAKFPVKVLDDPKGAFGEPEHLHWLARDGFSDDFPDAAEFIGQIKLDDDQYGSLEDTVVNQFDDGQEPEAIEQWLEENPDVMPPLED